MPATTSTEPASGVALRPRPTTRSSIRHSLNLSSVGKALADVMNKDASEKAIKKGKDTSSRRLSAMGLMQGTAAPRTSLGGSDSKSPVAKRSNTPDSKPVTRHTRRTSAVPRPATSSSDEQGLKAIDTFSPPQSGGISRSSSLRPRSAVGSSALPKYRPKSVIQEPVKKPPSPVRSGTRRRLSTSDEEKEGKMKFDTQVTQSPPEKSSRPISPLPQRALKVNLTSAINVTPSTPVKSSKATVSSPGKSSPTRAAKALKTTSTRSPNPSTIPRPPSSSSSSSAPRTPKTPSSFRNAFGLGRSGRDKASTGPSPLRSTIHAPPESPLAQHSRKSSKDRSPKLDTDTTTTPTTSHYTEGTSEDSIEVDDVEMLLAPVASLAAPTPAIPRIETHRPRKQPPQTPTRTSNLLPSRANLSYLSPVPASTDTSPSLRPKQRAPGNDRGSILSWEQLASESSRTLGQDEVNAMLGDVPAPFQSGRASRVVSPSPGSTQLDIPESPCLSALPSPGGYGRISQVLLPDVTPSPAVHHHQSQMFDEAAHEIPAVDAAIVTLLRLQLASAENIARERLERLQALEEQLHCAKQARIRDAEELAKQVSFLEDRLHGDVEARERTEEERMAYTASLEDQLRHAHAFREQAVEAAVTQARQNAKALQDTALQSEQHKWETACVAQSAAAGWTSVRELAVGELELVRSNREILSALLAGLDQSQRQICLRAM